MVAISVHFFWQANVRRVIPVASCRTPMSETYDMIGLPLGLSKCEMAIVLDSSASLIPVMGNPNEREKPIGSSMACTPVTMALLANTRLTTLKVGRRKFMIDRDEDYCMCLTELGLIKIKFLQRRNGMPARSFTLRDAFTEGIMF